MKPFKADMKKAGFTCEINMRDDALRQVIIITNKDELSSEERTLLKDVCDAVASAPDTGFDPDMKNQIAKCDYTDFKSFNGHDNIGSDRMTLGYWEKGGCVVLLDNND